jgi:hypothetical protein
MDKFYTNSSVVDLVVDMFERLVEASPDDVIIEPSAGNGAFLGRLASYPNLIATDILPERDGIVQCDFLEFAPRKPQGTFTSLATLLSGRTDLWRRNSSRKLLSLRRRFLSFYRGRSRKNL